jgi:hypothetical protein
MDDKIVKCPKCGYQAVEILGNNVGLYRCITTACPERYFIEIKEDDDGKTR